MKNIKNEVQTVAAVGMVLAMSVAQGFAAAEDYGGGQIGTAIDRIINWLTGVGFGIFMITLAVGFIQVMFLHQEKVFERLKNPIIGGLGLFLLGAIGKVLRSWVQ